MPLFCVRSDDLWEIILKNIYFFEECERIRRVRIVYIRKEKGRGEVSRVLLRKASGSDLESSFRLSIKRRFSSWQLAKFGTLYSSLGANDWDLIRGKMTLSTLPTVITISWSGNGVLSTNISFRFDSSFLSIVKCQVLCIGDERTNFRNFVNEKRETNYYFIRKFHRDIYIYQKSRTKRRRKKKKILSSIFHETTFSILAIETENWNCLPKKMRPIRPSPVNLSQARFRVITAYCSNPSTHYTLWKHTWHI